MHVSRTPLHRLILSAMIVGTVAMGVRAFAEETTPTEQLTLPIGSVFEILAQESAQGTQYAWVLSSEGTFLQAGRSRAFRTRFSEARKYLLSGELLTQSGTHERRNFLINVRADAPPTQATSPLQTDPPVTNGSIVLSSESRIVRILIGQGGLKDVAVDVDTSVDEDGDGNPANDQSAIGTFLSVEGLPLNVWITNALPTSIGIRATQPDGTAMELPVTITDTTTTSSEEPPALVSGGIVYQDEGGGDVRFGADGGFSPEIPALLYWDFGDGGQSMISEPVHSYTASGTYTVHLIATDLRNGIPMRDSTVIITVNASKQSPDQHAPDGAATSSASSSQVSSDEQSSTPTPVDGSPSRISVLFGGLRKRLPLILGIFGGVAGVALMVYLIALIVRKVSKGKSLAERLEQADKKMAIGKGQMPSLDSAAAPMPIDVEEPKEDTTTQAEQSQPEPPARNAPTPSWLQPTTPSASAPASTSTPGTAPTTDEHVPEWLKGGPTEEPIAPVTLIQEPQKQEPVTPKNAPTPAWLSAAENDTPAAPQPSESSTPSAQTMKSDPVTGVAPTVAASSAPLPSWLQPQATTPQEPQNQPPLKQETSVPFTPATPPNPLPSDAPNGNGDLPAWLQPQGAANAVETPTIQEPQAPSADQNRTPPPEPLLVPTPPATPQPASELTLPTGIPQATEPTPRPDDLPPWLQAQPSLTQKNDAPPANPSSLTDAVPTLPPSTPTVGNETEDIVLTQSPIVSPPSESAITPTSTSEVIAEDPAPVTPPLQEPPVTKQEKLTPVEAMASTPTTKLPESTTGVPAESPRADPAPAPTPEATVHPSPVVRLPVDKAGSEPPSAQVAAHPIPIVSPVRKSATSTPKNTLSNATTAGKATAKNATTTDREKERKRLKRQRYRNNKRKREMEATAQPIASATTDTPTRKPDDAPVAFIRADNIATLAPEEKSASEGSSPTGQ